MVESNGKIIDRDVKIKEILQAEYRAAHFDLLYETNYAGSYIDRLIAESKKSFIENLMKQLDIDIPVDKLLILSGNTHGFNRGMKGQQTCPP